MLNVRRKTTMLQGVEGHSSLPGKLQTEHHSEKEMLWLNNAALMK
jgi:hypothetical protein